MAAISVYGIYQSAVELPATQRQYEAHKEAALREAGLNYPPGTPLRDVFENRLKNREPLGTFLLTNSLAASLAPWLVVGLGIVVASWQKRRQSIGGLLCLAPIAVCLLMTKSRSGYAAVAVGIIWLIQSSRHTPCAVRQEPASSEISRGWGRRTDGTRPASGYPVPATLAAAVVIAALLIAGFVRPDLAKAAATSLGYRVQYWQATLRMIADRPLLGCGPGNFQDVYSRYKLPEASEEVSDPHDFLLEVWATAGTPALLALVATLGIFAWGNGRVGFSPPSHQGGLKPTLPDGAHHGALPTAWKLVLAGTIGGFLLSIPLGLISSAPPNAMPVALGLPVAIVCLVLLLPWVRDGTFAPGLAGLSVTVLLVDLLTTGGIGIPGIAQSLWLLMALGLGAAWPRELPRVMAIALLAIGLGLLVACYQTSYARVVPCQSSLRLARREYLDSDRQAALQAAQRAVNADPLSSDAQAFLAEIYVDAWLADLDPADYQAFESHDALARRMAPEAAPIWRASAERYRRAFAITDSRGRHVAPQAIEHAVEAARRAVELYPASGSDHVALAILYQLFGDEAAYRREAQIALELDGGMPHADKKLPEAVRLKLKAATEGTEQGKQAMQKAK